MMRKVGLDCFPKHTKSLCHHALGKTLLANSVRILFNFIDIYKSFKYIQIHFQLVQTIHTKTI